MSDKELMKAFKRAGGTKALTASTTLTGSERQAVLNWMGGAILTHNVRTIVEGFLK